MQRRAALSERSTCTHKARIAVQLAIAQGRFQKPNGRPQSAAILDVARDIAQGMQYLHSRAVTHGNLCSSSILLTPSSVQRFSESSPPRSHCAPCPVRVDP